MTSVRTSPVSFRCVLSYFQAVSRVVQQIWSLSQPRVFKLLSCFCNYYYMCLGRGRQTNLNNFRINFLAISGDSKHFSFLQKKSKNCPPIFFFITNLLIFCDLKPHAKFQKPKITPSGRKASVGEEKKSQYCDVAAIDYEKILFILSILFYRHLS